jgi:tripartite-type tricarboxylate transporter receptor subunit TctC
MFRIEYKRFRGKAGTCIAGQLLPKFSCHHLQRCPEPIAIVAGLDRPANRWPKTIEVSEMRRSPVHGLHLGLALLAGALTATPAASADVFQGKTINVIIGYSAGGGYDLYARLLAKHLGKHIPGNPTVVPQNMVGAGSMRAANYLYSIAPKDGTAIGIFSRSVAIAPLIASASFDARKFTWLGSMTKDVSVCITWNTSAIKSWDDMMSHQFVAGGEGAGSDPDIFALMYKNVMSAKVRLVSGYPGTNDITLAMERGEVDGLCGISWSTIKSRHADWISDKKINVPVQAALEKDPDLPQVPLALDLAQGAEQTQILKLVLATQVLARPIVAPPGLSADRVALLRKAFDDTMNDPEFRAEADKLVLDINPISGATIDALLAEIYATPKDVTAKAALAISQ